MIIYLTSQALKLLLKQYPLTWFYHGNLAPTEPKWQSAIQN